MTRPIHFEISAENPERANKFYEKVFDWKIEKWEGPQDYWLIMTGEKNQPGIDGGLLKKIESIAKEARGGYVCIIDVPSIEDFTEKIIANGGKLIAPKMPVPTVGWLAYFQDTEDNYFGIMQNDSSAA